MSEFLRAAPEGHNVVTANYLELAATGGLLAIKQENHRRLVGQNPNGRFLDVGCGEGFDIIGIANILGPNGAIVGLDHDQKNLSAALTRVQSTSEEVAKRIHLVQGDARRMGLKSGSFQGVYCERVAQYYPDEEVEKMLLEMKRVTGRRGKVTMFEPDWTGLSISGPDSDLTDRMIRYYLAVQPDAMNVRNPNIGSRLEDFVTQAGLEIETSEKFPVPVRSLPFARQVFQFDQLLKDVPAADKAEFDRQLEESARAGTFEARLPGGIVVGRKR